MTFSVGILRPAIPRIPSPRNPLVEEYDSSSSTDSGDTATNFNSRSSTSFAAHTSATGSRASPVFLFPPSAASGRSSRSTSASNTPVPSRSVSPLPQFYSSGPSSSCTSDTDSEPSSPLLGRRYISPLSSDDRRRWWTLGTTTRRRRRRDVRYLRMLKKAIRRLLRHPFFPRQPITIVLTLLLLTVFAIFLTLLLIHILNPDKEPLPWRAYCSVPSPSSPPDFDSPGSASSYPIPPSIGSGLVIPRFPPPNLDSLPPAGLFIGIFSMDSAFERRMLVRTTWASHPRSRDGAGNGDGGKGTSRTVVRFVLAQPRKDWERRIKLEMEMYNDIVLLPGAENMNSGKTHSFFTWSSEHAWVPPIYFNTSASPPALSYANLSTTPPPLAPHDPIYARRDKISHVNSRHSKAKPWVRPDFVVKVDDDSFVMLAELESRLRLELHAKAAQKDDPYFSSTSFVSRDHPPESTSPNASTSFSSSFTQDPISHDSRSPGPLNDDPLVYWGYLVKNRFMAGELYALSWSLADWVAKDPVIKGLTRGAEDKQTAKWMRLHPKAREVRWTSERCWIYDHPRAGTVYSHGFLFPSEVTRVRRSIVSYFDKTPQDILEDSASSWPSAISGSNTPTPSAWAYSTVSTFGVRYMAPLPDLTTQQSVEALVEGSDMSVIREDSPMTPEYAWLHREGRKKKYESQRIGGTVVVHFIKKNMWFLETALALLEGDEYSEAEKLQVREAERTKGKDISADLKKIKKAIQTHRLR